MRKNYHNSMFSDFEYNHWVLIEDDAGVSLFCEQPIQKVQLDFLYDLCRYLHYVEILEQQHFGISMLRRYYRPVIPCWACHTASDGVQGTEGDNVR